MSLPRAPACASPAGDARPGSSSTAPQAPSSYDASIWASTRADGSADPRYLSLKEFKREYSIVRGDLARGIDPQLKTVAVDPDTAKHIPASLLPDELRKIFPEGVVEGTVGALLADYLQHHAASHLTPRGYLNYRQLTRSYLTSTYKIPVLQFGEEDVCVPVQQAGEPQGGAAEVEEALFVPGRAAEDLLPDPAQLGSHGSDRAARSDSSRSRPRAASRSRSTASPASGSPEVQIRRSGTR
jgi:hypothetical protein